MIKLCCLLKPWCRCSECDWVTCRQCVPSNISAYKKHNDSVPKCALATLGSIYDIRSYRDKADVHVIERVEIPNEIIRGRSKKA